MSDFVPYAFYLFLYSFDIMPFLLNLQKLSNLWISQLVELLNRRPIFVAGYERENVPCFFEISFYTPYRNRLSAV